MEREDAGLAAGCLAGFEDVAFAADFAGDLDASTFPEAFEEPAAGLPAEVFAGGPPALAVATSGFAGGRVVAGLTTGLPDLTAADGAPGLTAPGVADFDGSTLGGDGGGAATAGFADGTGGVVFFISPTADIF